MKLAVLYHSETGNTERVAEIVAQGANEVDNVEAKTMGIEELDDEFVEEAEAVIFGTPTYLANFSWQTKKWFDTEMDYDLSGKLGAVFATENYLGGGADMALLTMIGHMLVRGMVIYSGGAAEGKPYTHYGAVCIQDGDEDQQERAEIFGERVASKALELFA
ncbi:flavodoxin family protein [Acetohalobium arabaticum]|uniref:Flavodoxin/nitric oxide synthase n=1 Tax=Acetohalobium arabaticum (strain ATCC 49924 / DSM 5501 / Z-7288) TaxID=574087 RepID=D9QQH0_ACEAZ|nr:flavodoxin family protein [Acetohalobium arabaticum]ADL12761.1 flavodoxin/nitric oxide synthase [Acetohalobium arabaticum DSM 5501]